MLRHTSLFALLVCAGCFRDLDAVHGPTATETTFTLEVGDANASRWDADNAPRTPRMTLRANPPFGRDAERHLFLLRGVPSEETLADLGSGTVRESTAQQQVALQVARVGAAGEQLEAQPLAPLAPGADYTLVWVDARSRGEFALRVSHSPAAGSRLVQTMPAALDARVPPNLARALLRFDGYITGALEQAFVLRDAAGQALAQRTRVLACAQLGLPAGDCVELTPEAPLAALARYTLSVGAGLLDATGVPLPEQEVGFRTAASHDLLPPSFLPNPCAKDEIEPVRGVCSLASETEIALRVRGNENGLLSLSCADQTQRSLGSAGDYALTLPLERAAACVLVLTDLAGNQLSDVLNLAPAADLARVAIVEVRADPLGSEPAQEYVELLNFGDEARSLEGFTLTTDVFANGAAIVGDVSLAAGEHVLVVAPDFDAQETSDGELPQGVRIARLERALALRNDGAELVLRDAQGRRLSAAPALAARPGQCIARSGQRYRQGSPLDFRPDPSGACTPGFGSDPP